VDARQRRPPAIRVGMPLSFKTEAMESWDTPEVRSRCMMARTSRSPGRLPYCRRPPGGPGLCRLGRENFISIRGLFGVLLRNVRIGDSHRLQMHLADCAIPIDILLYQELCLLGACTDLAHDRLRLQPDNASTGAFLRDHAKIINQRLRPSASACARSSDSGAIES
jgi:hypothetical protein